MRGKAEGTHADPLDIAVLQLSYRSDWSEGEKHGPWGASARNECKTQRVELIHAIRR
jgi:hypothetical protein